MDVATAGTLVVAVLALAAGLYSMRSDRSKTIVETTDIVLGWKDDRITALGAEMTGLHNEIATLRKCLVKHGINPEGCV